MTTDYYYVLSFNPTILPPNFDSYIEINIAEYFDIKNELNFYKTYKGDIEKYLYIGSINNILIEKIDYENDPLVLVIGDTEYVIKTKYFNFMNIIKYDKPYIKSLNNIRLFIPNDDGVNYRIHKIVNGLKTFNSNYQIHYNVKLENYDTYTLNYKMAVRFGWCKKMDVYHEKKIDENMMYKIIEDNPNMNNDLITLLDDLVQHNIVEFLICVENPIKKFFRTGYEYEN